VSSQTQKQNNTFVQQHKELCANRVSQTHAHVHRSLSSTNNHTNNYNQTSMGACVGKQSKSKRAAAAAAEDPVERQRKRELIAAAAEQRSSAAAKRGKGGAGAGAAKNPTKRVAEAAITAADTAAPQRQKSDWEKKNAEALGSTIITVAK
jgi:hypothetical protein